MQAAAQVITEIPLSISPALTVQRRPPLVRAMSAPVRGFDETNKGVIAASKRSQQKLRRRKIFTRTASSSVAGGASVPVLDVIGGGDSTGGPGSGNGSAAGGNASKKTLNRARSVVAPDVITLVSLLSSEGSDSEREDNCSTVVASPPAIGAEKQPQGPNQRRAPLLRKTGKSGKFQDLGFRDLLAIFCIAFGPSLISLLKPQLKLFGSLVSRQLSAHLSTGLQGVLSHDTPWIDSTTCSQDPSQSTAHSAARFHLLERRTEQNGTAGEEGGHRR